MIAQGERPLGGVGGEELCFELCKTVVSAPYKEVFTWRWYRVDFSNSGAERGKIKGPERHGFWDIVREGEILGKCQDLARKHPSKKKKKKKKRHP